MTCLIQATTKVVCLSIVWSARAQYVGRVSQCGSSSWWASSCSTPRPSRCTTVERWGQVCTYQLHHLYWSTIVDRNTGCVGQAPPPPPPVGVRLILVHSFEPPLQDSWIRQCLRVWVTPRISVHNHRSRNKGWWVRHTPPPAPPKGFDSCTCIQTPFQDSWLCQCIHVSYTTYIGLRLLVEKYGDRGASPPPPPP